MKQSCLTVWLILLLLLTGCGKSLPENFGVYADTNHGLIELKGARATLRGNLFSAYGGLEGPSGAECDKLERFIVYKEGVGSDDIRVAELGFQRAGKVDAILTKQSIDLNLWVPQNAVSVAIKPVKDRPSMYVVEPRAPLQKGFYALYFRDFGSPMEGGSAVYDIAVGKAMDFPSYRDALKTKSDKLKEEASRLLGSLNDIYKSEDFSQLESVYRPSGQVLSGAELQEFVSGTRTWREASGGIVNSRITGQQILDGGNRGVFELVTTYAKAGVQKESIEVRQIGDRYFITALK
jgi:hypothetical protein